MESHYAFALDPEQHNPSGSAGGQWLDELSLHFEPNHELGEQLSRTPPDEAAACGVAAKTACNPGETCDLEIVIGDLRKCAGGA